MTNKFLIPTSCFISLIAIIWFVAGPAAGYTIIVPPIGDLIKGVDTIVLCKVSKSVDGKMIAVVSETLKGDAKLVGKSIEVVSPHPSMVFPFAKWVGADGDNDVILFGDWKTVEQTGVKQLSLVYGSASYWPRGMPRAVSKVKTLEEGKGAVQKCLLEMKSEAQNVETPLSDEESCG